MKKKLKASLPLLTITLIAAFLRFYNLKWGDGYFFHPDENNMARSVAQMCLKSDALHAIESDAFNKALNQGCSLNPHFFAYGQFPLYLAFFSSFIFSIISILKFPSPNFQVYISNAVFWLRFWSATAGTLTVLLVYLVTKTLLDFSQSDNHVDIRVRKRLFATIAALLAAFTPGLIQASHFGTTESLLTLFFMLTLFLSLKLLTKKCERINLSILAASIIAGLALATKLTAAYFLTAPLLTILLLRIKSQISNFKFLISVSSFFIFTFLFFILSSPYNLLQFQEFRRISSYEANVATGKTQTFYTRQFIHTTPFLFQFTKIFPYALGLPLFTLGLLGFLSITHMLFTNIKKQYVLRVTCYVLLIIAFLAYFVPNSLLFAKWTRFMTPIFPFFSIFTAYLFYKFQAASSKRFSHWNLIVGIFVTAVIIQGLLTATIYMKPDVRFTASQWIHANVPNGSYILSETGNVVDIPLPSLPRGPLSRLKGVPFQGYHVINFDFYHIDENPRLLKELPEHLVKADYILVPSRRIFANLPADEAGHPLYPITLAYYNSLFSGRLGFELVHTETSFPSILYLYLPSIIQLSDEFAEETWSVFDHPVIRVYKKTKQYEEKYYQNLLNPNLFSLR